MTLVGGPTPISTRRRDGKTHLSSRSPPPCHGWCQFCGSGVVLWPCCSGERPDRARRSMAGGWRGDGGRDGGFSREYFLYRVVEENSKRGKRRGNCFDLPSLSLRPPSPAFLRHLVAPICLISPAIWSASATNSSEHWAKARTGRSSRSGGSSPTTTVRAGGRSSPSSSSGEGMRTSIRPPPCPRWWPSGSCSGEGAAIPTWSRSTS